MVAEVLDKLDCEVGFPCVKKEKTITESRSDLFIKPLNPVAGDDLAGLDTVVVFLDVIGERGHLVIIASSLLAF